MSIHRMVFPRSGSPRGGFTLVELLVVISIIAMLVGMMLPAVNSVIESSRRNKCINSLSQVVKAMANYESLHNSYPPGRMGCDTTSGNPCGSARGDSRSGSSGFLALLLQLDEQNLYWSFMPFAKGAVYPAVADDKTEGWASDPIPASLTARPSILVCPSNNAKPIYSFPTASPPLPNVSTSSYALVMGSLGNNSGTGELQQKYSNNGPFVYYYPRRSADVRGLDATLFVGEVVDADQAGSMNAWPLAVAHLSCLRSTDNSLNTPTNPSAPGYVPRNPVAMEPVGNHGLSGLPTSATGAFGSRHPTGANFGFGDGHAKFISNDIDFQLYKTLSQINRDQPITGEY